MALYNSESYVHYNCFTQSSDFMKTKSFFLYTIIPLFVIAVTMMVSCSSKDEPIEIDPRLANKSKDELADEVRRLTVTAAEKDSLFNEVVETTKFISEVYTELSALSGELNTKGIEQKSTDYKQEITKKIQVLSKRLQENEKRLRENQTRIAELKKKNKSFAAQIANYEKVVADLNIIIQNQKTEIAVLNEKVTELTGQVAILTEQKTELTEKVQTLTEETNTGFYIVGTGGYLTDNNVIERKGAVLFFGGKRVPKENFNTSLFTAINITKQNEITLPEKVDEIISNHNSTYLKISDDGKKITITDPKKFWQTSKYLIIMVEG